MPTWLYTTVLIVSCVVVSPILGALLFCAAMKVCRAPRSITRRTFILIGAAMLVLQLATLAGIGSERGWAAVISCLATFAILYLAAGVLGGAKWARSTLIILTFGAFSIGLSLPLAVVLRRTIAESFNVPTAGMAPAITGGDRILADRTIEPRRWDIVVYRRPSEDKLFNVARLVGLPGEQVEIAPPGIKINGAPIPFPADLKSLAYICRQYPSQPSRSQWICTGCGTPITLGPDEYFVLGDNSAASLDSRYWDAAAGHQAGALTRDRIRGVVRACFAPLDRLHVFR